MNVQIIKEVSDRGAPEYVAWLLLQGIALKEEKFVSGYVSADKE